VYYVLNRKWIASRLRVVLLYFSFEEIHKIGKCNVYTAFFGGMFGLAS
jgi:hypothetical protein